MASDAVPEMSGLSSVQRAHDELLSAMPEGAIHEGCPMCERDSGVETAKEVVPMSDEKVFSEAQHVSLVTSAVERETSALTATNESLTTEVASLTSANAELASSNTELSNKADVLESEKAAETARADAETARAEAAEKALEDFKAELAELAAIEVRKVERADAIKAADATLSDEYFTDARVERWAQMPDAQFASLVEDLTEAAAKKIPAPAAKGDQVDKNGDSDETPTLRQNARETSAFSGGDAPTAPAATTSGSFLSAIGKLPVPASN